MWLVACGGSGSDSSAQAVEAVDACSLLSDAEVHAVAPDVGSGHPGSVQIPGASVCQWDDSKHLPALTLQVTAADPADVKKGLEDAFANMGYDVISVPGLGDEAAVAVQRPDPSHGIESGVAVLAVRVGKRELALSPMRLNITTIDSTDFEHLKQAAAQAVARLRAK
jgi:hypothetical protein